MQPSSGWPGWPVLRPGPCRASASRISEKIRSRTAGCTRRSSNNRNTPGAGSCRSWNTTSKSTRSSGEPTPSDPQRPLPAGGPGEAGLCRESFSSSLYEARPDPPRSLPLRQVAHTECENKPACTKEGKSRGPERLRQENQREHQRTQWQGEHPGDAQQHQHWSQRPRMLVPAPAVVDDSQRGKEHPQAQESRAKAESASREGIDLNNLSGHGDQAKERRQQHQYLAARFSPVCPARRA